MTTKFDMHNYIKYNAFIDKDSNNGPTNVTTGPKAVKPTLASCGNKMSTYRKEIRKFYANRKNNKEKA